MKMIFDGEIIVENILNGKNFYLVNIELMVQPFNRYNSSIDKLHFVRLFMK